MKKISVRALLVLGAMIVLTGFGAFMSSVNAKDNAAKPFWSERCTPVANSKSGEKYCEVFQRLTILPKGAKQPMRLIEMAVGFPAEAKGTARGVMVLPLGISLESPVKVQIAGKDQFVFRVRMCQTDGCYAVFDLPQDQIKILKTNDSLTVNIPSVNGKIIAILMSLKDFAPALDKIKS